MRNRTIAVAFASLLLAVASASAQSPNDYEMVMVPVFFSGPGAVGSDWTTDTEMINTGATPIVLGRALSMKDSSCPTCGCKQVSSIPSNQAMRICPDLAHASGLLLHVPNGTPRESLQIQTRIRDLSRQADSAGTEVPVVWRSDFHESDQNILFTQVPVDSRFRTGLRIYNLHPYRPVATIRIYDRQRLLDDLLDPLIEAQIPFDRSEPAESPDLFPRRPPWFISIGDLVARFPQLASSTSVVIELQIGYSIADPPRPDDVAWALLTVTNNTTQQVTVLSPN